MSKSKDKKEGESFISRLGNAAHIILRLIAGRARVIAALIGIILILFATTLPAISFVFDNPNEEGSTEIMWDGDLIRAETGIKINTYEEAQKIWYPFLTGPLTPDLIIYLGIIVAIAGLILRSIGVMREMPEFEKRGRYSFQGAMALFWVALGLLFLYFLGIQSSTKGINLLESTGAILVVIGNVVLIPISSTYDFKIRRSKK
ncbi:MAG: hypothetical protein ACFFGZ_04860 [Candidatus Thorarchaeota archaeon]